MSKVSEVIEGNRVIFYVDVGQLSKTEIDNMMASVKKTIEDKLDARHS